MYASFLDLIPFLTADQCIDFLLQYGSNAIHYSVTLILILETKAIRKRNAHSKNVVVHVLPDKFCVEQETQRSYKQSKQGRETDNRKETLIIYKLLE